MKFLFFNPQHCDSYSTFLIRFLPLLLIAIFLGGCGRSIVYDDEGYPLHGKAIIFKEQMYELSNLIEGAADKESHKYNCILDRESELYRYNETYFLNELKNIKKIEGQMHFKVEKSYRVIPYGLQTAFSREYHMLVLKDSSDNLCTFPEFSVNNDEWVEKTNSDGNRLNESQN